MRLIGLTGKKQAGKDSTYLAIKAVEAEAEVIRVSFADKLKEVAAEILGKKDEPVARMDELKERHTVRVHHDSYPMTPEYMLTGREFLQNFGVACRNHFGQEFWVNQALPVFPVLEDLYPGTDIICVTDVRFINEAHRISQLGGEIWELRRPGLDESDAHITEQSLPESDIDLIVSNNGTLEDLKDLVRKIL